MPDLRIWWGWWSINLKDWSRIVQASVIDEDERSDD